MKRNIYFKETVVSQLEKVTNRKLVCYFFEGKSNRYRFFLLKPTLSYIKQDLYKWSEYTVNWLKATIHFHLGPFFFLP